MKLRPVQDQPHLSRDMNTGAVIYTDKKLINRKKEIKSLRKAEQDKVKELTQQVDSLQNDVSEIKNLLIKLVEK